MTFQDEQNKKLVEGILYLASLVSDPGAIDPKLDVLRGITARPQPDGVYTITDQDREALSKVQSDIQEYLVAGDPVRSYTKESLQQNLDRYLSSKDPKAKARRATTRQLINIFALAFAAYSVGIILAPGALITKAMLAAPLFLVQLHAGLAWLFLSARKDMAAALRVAFGYIGAGLLASAFGSVQFPILFAYPALTEMPVFRYAGFMPLFAGMCVLFYIGLYIYARQLPAIRLRFLKPGWIVTFGVAVSLIVIAMPHAVHVPEEGFFDLSLVSTAMSVWFSVPAAILGFAIVRHVTDRYAQGMRLFAGAQIAVAFACAVFFGVLFVSGAISGTRVAVSALPFAISEGLMLAAAYRFKRNASE